MKLLVSNDPNSPCLEELPPDAPRTELLGRGPWLAEAMVDYDDPDKFIHRMRKWFERKGYLFRYQVFDDGDRIVLSGTFDQFIAQRADKNKEQQRDYMRDYMRKYREK